MLLKRNKTYYFRWQIPQDLRPKFNSREFIRSLHTSCKTEALLRMSELSRLVLIIKITRKKRLLHQLTQENYLSEIQVIKQKMIDEGVRLRAFPDTDPLAVAEISRKVLAAELCEIDLATPDFPPEEWGLLGLPQLRACSYYSSAKIRTARLVSDEHLNHQLATHGLETTDRAIKTKFKRDYLGFEIAQIDRQLDALTGRTPITEVHRAKAGTTNQGESRADGRGSAMFSEVSEQYVVSKEKAKKFTVKTAREARNFIKGFIAVMGDMPIADWRARHMDYCMEGCSQLPAKNKKPYNKMMYPEILELGGLPEDDLISVSQLGHAKKYLKAIFKFASAEEFISANPCRDWSYDIGVKNIRGNYTDDEVAIMYREAFNLEGHKKWMVLLGMCTGARLTELVNLRVEDIKFDDESRRHYISISPEAGSLKSKAARRRVPLHKKLVDLGFLEMVANVGAGRLWPSLKAASITSFFVRFREKAGVERQCEFGNNRVFHSFRHWVVTKARSEGVEGSAVQQVVGHERDRGMEVTDRYTHDYPIKTLLPVIDSLNVG